jgi:hypothetical protein
VGVVVGVWCVWVGLSLVCVFLFVVGGSHTAKSEHPLDIC